MQVDKKRFLVAVSILVGTCIGAGVLGIPFVAAQAGFSVALVYIVLIGLMIFLVNLYLGEIALRTKGDHQLPGYANKYLGKKGFYLMEFATVFGIYSAIVAYIWGVGESLSFLITKNGSYTLLFGVVFALFMSWLLWGGIKSLKKFEKYGVAVILSLLVVIFIVFIKKIDLGNLYTFFPENIFLPFGVILFALMSFHAIPEIKIVLRNKEKLMKKVLVTGTLVSIVFYTLFAFVVVGFKGIETPEIATLALGTIFVFLGIFTMFTSYFALGVALMENFVFDERFKKSEAWFFTAIVPIFVFVLIKTFDYFSFTKILGIGGVVSGGLTGILVLLMITNAKQKGDRIPEFSVPVSWFVIGLLSLIFILGVIVELI